ncbi:hypothetical protein ACRRS0_02870 [Agarivorans sp. QJM3NY_29]|uniref:hypothetical protein n=1 Tax=unclassified Agarivorans TaxID=2636026 RepID=UPI003D7C5A75
MVFELLLIFLGALALFLFRRSSSEREWMDLPLYDEYLSSHPETALATGAQCFHCHSEQIWEYGVDSLMDYRRENVCLACGTRLWRSEQESLTK